MPSPKKLSTKNAKLPGLMSYKIGDKIAPKKRRKPTATNFEKTHFYPKLRDALAEGLGISEVKGMPFTKEVKERYRLTKPNAMRHIQRSVDKYVRTLGFGPEYIVRKIEGMDGTTFIEVKHIPVIHSMNKGATA